ncbi:hypothetical protein C8J57DRAFT_1713789 [Mycena rebaudengoi]|nr:hypothetical protein C8J57DRAFT_1713789 [Mycena rebaudengoi]
MDVHNLWTRSPLDELDTSLFEKSPQIELLDVEHDCTTMDPVLILPLEIICDIFLHCISTGSYWPSPRKAPLLLLTICRAWRDIALSFPALWSHLDIAVRDPQTMVSFVNRWFSRAAGSPLSLRLSGYLGVFAVPLDAVIGHAATNLQSLALKIDAECTARPQHVGTLPVLRKLRFTSPMTANFFHDDGHAPLLTFRDTPDLRELYLEGISTSRIVVPYAQLTLFSIGHTALQDCLRVVREARALRELHIYRPKDDGTNTGHLPISHPALLSLRLGYLNPKQISRLLTLPALGSLDIAHLLDLDFNPEFLAFLSHSSTSLREFKFNTIDTLVDVRWFSAMSNLTCLEIRVNPRPWRTRGVLFLALNRAVEKNVLPNLLRLLVFGCRSLDILDADVLGALDSRVGIGEEAGLASLQSFTMTFWAFNSPRVTPLSMSRIAALDNLVARGLNIHLETTWGQTYDYRHGCLET